MRLTRQAFAEWLDSKLDNRSVGDPEDTNSCALCRFLKAQGATHVDMQYMHRTVFFGLKAVSSGRSVKNPLWMQTYQRRAVKVAKWIGIKNITAGTARKILENV